jgi:hypothetical protein
MPRRPSKLKNTRILEHGKIKASNQIISKYNFEVLENPPKYEPTLCARCKKVIRLGEDGYTVTGKEYICEKCSDKEFGRLFEG